MAFPPQHELHKRRFSRNLGLGLTLAAFVALVFALTVVKVTRGEMTPTPMAPAAMAPAEQPAATGDAP
ncbi:hypothetical protein [Tabrizicola soli]|uniref:Cytochrome C oxidase assembly protein n=1 Tax=Tabrizicola soli TaxID=2185115 RepID=A0ABV7DSU2_9RHOB|nr:hypothetical protein [Tabrizicola soli]